MEEQVIEAQGMQLANRAYLYRLFHIVFGAEPSREELRAFGAQETADVLRTEALTDMQELLTSLAGKADDVAFVAECKSDFTRLFLVPGVSYVHPWESPYIGKETMLFQESTLDVRHRYAEYGFVASEFGHFPEDHISMMLDFLAHLSTQAFEAFADGNDDAVKRILSFQKDFVATHLMNWLPQFYDALCERDNVGTYRRFARALHAFLACDERCMDHILLELDSME